MSEVETNYEDIYSSSSSSSSSENEDSSYSESDSLYNTNYQPPSNAAEHQPINTQDLEEEEEEGSKAEGNKNISNNKKKNEITPPSLLFTYSNLLDICIYNDIKSLFDPIGSLFQAVQLEIPYEIQLKLFSSALFHLFQSKQVNNLFTADIKQILSFVELLKEFPNLTKEIIIHIQNVKIKLKQQVILRQLEKLINNKTALSKESNNNNNSNNNNSRNNDNPNDPKPLDEIAQLHQDLFVTDNEAPSDIETAITEELLLFLQTLLDSLCSHNSNNKKYQLEIKQRILDHCNQHSYNEFCDDILSLLTEIKSTWPAPFYSKPENLPDWSYFTKKSLLNENIANNEMKINNQKNNNDNSKPNNNNNNENSQGQNEPIEIVSSNDLDMEMKYNTIDTIITTDTANGDNNNNNISRITRSSSTRKRPISIDSTPVSIKSSSRRKISPLKSQENPTPVNHDIPSNTELTTAEKLKTALTAAKLSKIGDTENQNNNNSLASSAPDFGSFPALNAHQLLQYCDRINLDYTTVLFQLHADILAFKGKYGLVSSDPLMDLSPPAVTFANQATDLLR